MINEQALPITGIGGDLTVSDQEPERDFLQEPTPFDTYTFVAENMTDSLEKETEKSNEKVRSVADDSSEPLDEPSLPITTIGYDLPKK